MEQQETLPLLESEDRLLTGLIEKGENLGVEFKDDHRDFSDSLIYESVVAMTNTAGGILLVGVNDKGKVTGSHRISNRVWKSTESIAGMIMANTMPSCATAVSVSKHGGITLD